LPYSLIRSIIHPFIHSLIKSFIHCPSAESGSMPSVRILTRNLQKLKGLHDHLSDFKL